MCFVRIFIYNFKYKVSIFNPEFIDAENKTNVNLLYFSLSVKQQYNRYDGIEIYTNFNKKEMLQNHIKSYKILLQ